MRILDFPELRQTYEWDCGAKALQAIFTYYGIELREELIMKSAKTNARSGTSIDDMLRAIKKYGLDHNAGEMTLADIREYIEKQIPVILLVQAWSGKKRKYTHDYRDGHWVVAIGYNRLKIFFEDPYTFERTFLTNAELLKRWHGGTAKKKIQNFGIAVYGRKPRFTSRNIIHMD